MKDLCKLLRKPIVLEAMGWGNSKLYENIHNDLFIEPVKSAKGRQRGQVTR